MSYLVESIYSSDSDEWYSPHAFIKAARTVLCEIDLDPASCPLANQVVQARRIYTKEENGLTQDWTCATMWLNPPYGRLGMDRQHGQTELWVQRLIDEYSAGRVQEAILLVNAYLYKVWFAPLWVYPICFPTGRLSFWNEQGKSGRSPHSSALVYFGHQVQTFVDVFSVFGPVVKAMVPSPTSQEVEQQLQLW